MARRGRAAWGEGSYYQHGSRWRVSVSLGSDAFGKRVRKEWQVRSEEAAKAKLRDVNRRLRGGLPAEESRVTVGVQAQEWLAAVRPNVRPATYSFYKTLAEVHLDELGSLPIVRIMPSDIRSLIARRLNEGYSTRTVRGIVDVLRMILKQGVIDGILTRNVAELVQLPKLEQAEPKHFSADEARRFLDAARDDPLSSFFAVALGTGLRRGELLGLTWRDYDHVRAVVAVRRSKTNAGVRSVPLPAFAVEALAREERRPGPIWPVSPWAVSRRMTLLCEKAGLPRMGLHGLRHSTASLLYAEGVPEFVIQSILGHSKVGMTRHYTHVEIEQQRDAMGKLGRAIG